MMYLLDTNILSDLIRHPRGHIWQCIARIGEARVCTSVIVAAELRYGASKSGSARLLAQVRAVLAVMQVCPLEPPVDEVYGRIRTLLELAGQPVGANDLLIAAQTIALDSTLVTDNEREFARIENLRLENWLR